MVKDHKELVKACGELDLDNLKVKIDDEYKSSFRNMRRIKDEALQWAREIKEKLQEKQTSPMPPRTPTLKRPTRKRKIPTASEVEEKENSIAVGRQARAASQAAASKFHKQLYVPVKLRRPSEKPAEVPPAKERKRVRIASSSAESDDDAVSVASTTKSTKLKRAARKNKKEVSDDESSEEAEKPQKLEKPKMNTRGRAKLVAQEKKLMPAKKMKVVKPADSSDSEFEKPPAKATSSSEASNDEPNSEHVETSKDEQHSEHVESSNEEKNSEHAETTREETHSDQSQEETSPPNQNIKKNDALLLSRVVAIKVEKLSETFIKRQIGEDVSTEEATTEESEPPVSSPEPPATETQRKSPRTNKVETKVPDKASELRALTPHIAGKVKEMVMAVEQSLKKGYPKVNIQNHPEHAATTPHSPSKWLKAPELMHAISSQDISPDPFSESKHAYSPTVLRKKSIPTCSKPTTSQQQGLSTIQRSTVTRPHNATSTLSRSKVIISKFTLEAAKEQAQLAAVEVEKKKELERQLRDEKINEAQKKKEEILKLKMEEKKKINEEKKKKVKQVQEQRQKELEAQQKEKEELQLRKQEEKSKKNKFEELKAKRLAKKVLQEEAKKKLQEEAKKAKEEEEELNRKAEELKKKEEEKKKRDEEKKKKDEEKKKKEEEKKAALKLDAAKKLAAAASVREKEHVQTAVHEMNCTFTMPKEDTCKTPKPKAPNPVLAKVAGTESYEVTPSRDEMPPAPPKSDNDYGIDEVEEGDSSDDDEKPKKKVPLWAQKMKNNMKLDCADYVRVNLRNNFFGTRVFKPSVKDLFGDDARPLTRRSSAVWNTPPNLHHMTLNASMLQD
ncbi:inner centromere protein A-like [Neocloeon triangulifer]|uniref:inner centromere protein A-like n=1 Tax=Neocloeon triangulifer TaxID=2078957 RepID=UPI00286ECC0D|nr:inner centromere protein A-like [Neocloeon triangulifer]